MLSEPWDPHCLLGIPLAFQSHCALLSVTFCSNAPFQIELRCGCSLLLGTHKCSRPTSKNQLSPLLMLCTHLNHKAVPSTWALLAFSPWAGTWRERAPLICLVFLALTGCLAQSRLSGDICWMNKQSLLPHISHLYKHYGYPPSMESHLSLYLTKKRRNQILLRYSRVCISPDLKKKYTHKHKWERYLSSVTFALRFR